MRVRLACAVAAATLAAACSSGGGSAPALSGAGPTGASVTAAATTPPAPTGSAATSAALRGYLDYWTALRHAQATANPDDPLLAAHAVGAALADAQAGVRTNIARGVRLRGAVGHRPQLQAGADAGTVRDCVDLSRWLAYDARTGRRATGIATLRRIVATYGLTRSGGVWKVATARQGAAC